METQQNLVTRRLYEQFNELTNSACEAIRKALPDDDRFYFDEEGFEDEAGNEIHAVDEANVYFGNEESPDDYALEVLGFHDAIKVIETIEMLKARKEKVK